jgi:hypothetical protein
MSCCGKKREQIRRNIISVTTSVENHKPAEPAVLLRYTGSTSLLVRGHRSGQTYFFSASQPEQAVQKCDVDTLRPTGLFATKDSKPETLD